MAEINWTDEAERWLKDIHNYISQDSPESAIRIVDSLYKKAQLLRQFPEMGYKYDKILNHSVRILLYGHYRIAYLIKPDGDIDILGVFHGSLDIDRYL
ncbi:MAG: type II toxin-antitoxin system RelE/ParE family toxin [Kiritimatiellia bacterium]|nr:type II toxin-antitoxin system RelE/ParE family toxin [Kiritimatiellia bacterium]